VISPVRYDSVAGSLALAGEDAVLQVGDSLRKLHLSAIKNPENIIAAGKVFDSRTRMTLSAWNKKWQAWTGDDLAGAYLTGASYADNEMALLGLAKGEGKITSGVTLAGKDAVLAGTKGISNSVKSSFLVSGLPHHLTFYNTFKEATVSLLEKTSLQILRTTQDLHRNVAIMAGEATFKEADIFTRKILSQTMLDDYAKRGLTSVVYKNGARVSIDAYAEMVGRTMSSHAAVQASLNRYTEYGYNLVRITSHFTACELCAPWEGQILNKNGGDAKYRGLDEAIAAGLFHPNCRHDVNPYFPGISPDKLVPRVDTATQKLIDEHGYVPAQKITYKAEQQQRYIERNIKNWKRRELVSLDPVLQRKAHRKVLDWQLAQRKHITQNPFLRRKYDREGMKGWYDKVRASRVSVPVPVLPVPPIPPSVPPLKVWGRQALDTIDNRAPNQKAWEAFMKDMDMLYDEDYIVRLGDDIYEIRTEGWFDDCMESRGLGKTSKAQIRDTYRGIMEAESGWKVDIAGYMEEYSDATYGVTYVGRRVGQVEKSLRVVQKTK